ncbi:MAG: 50S ribosomal protein L9 [Ignavibacteria bacterium]|nr:50S ribosomal protein L9 [Ignavibacteria bacterium]
MKIVLRKDIETLGKIGEVVVVKDGYARNYLLPRNLAFPATPNFLRVFEEEKKQLVKSTDKKRKTAEELALKLNTVSVTIPVKVGEEDKIFGSVTSQMISNALTEKGFTIEKNKISLDEQIKALGIFEVKINLFPEVNAVIKVWVVRE